MIKKDVETLNGEPDWKVRALDREGWRIGCDGMVLMDDKPQRRRRRKIRIV